MNESGTTAIPDNYSDAFYNDTLDYYYEWSSDDQKFLNLIRIVVSIVFSLIVIIGFVGNLLVIIVVVSNKKMQNTTNILIVSLAVADLSFISFCVPFTATTYTMSRWPFGDVWCKIVQYLTYVCAYASVYTLVLMSLDRYLAVVHPITSMRIRNSRNTYIMVYLTWIIMLGGNIPVIFEFSHKEFNDNSNRSSCVDIDFFKSDYRSSQPFYGCFFAFGYVIPLTLTCILYGFMIKRLLYGVVPGGSQRPDSMRTKKRVTRMVVIVVVIFAICWLPIQIIFVLISFGHVGTNSHFFVGTLIASNCLAYMNSCVNPVLYAFLSENFRRSFRRLLCCASDPLSKFEYEKTNVRGIEKESKETLLNNTSKSTATNGSKDKNSNSENALPLQTLNKI